VLFAIGIGLYQRKGTSSTRAATQLTSDPGRFYSEETVRMLKVQRTFLIIEYVELGIITLSAVAVCKHRPILLGVALGGGRNSNAGGSVNPR
jgi:hypothetical protein